MVYGNLKQRFEMKLQSDGLLLSDIERIKELKERFESTHQTMKDTNQKMKDIINECENLPCTEWYFDGWGNNVLLLGIVLLKVMYQFTVLDENTLCI